MLDYSAAPGEQNRVLIFHAGADGFRVFDTNSAVTAGSGCMSVSVNEAFCPAELGDPGTSSLQIHVDGGDMNDFIEIDAVFYREAVLEGGEGADELQGGGSLNILDGGPGSDTFRPGFQGSYQNVVDYSSRTNPISVSIGDGAANDGEAGEQDLIEDGIGRVWGGSGNDFISAHAEGFISFDLFGRGGDDTITVDSGDSFLYGGSGNDTLVALSSPEEGFWLWGGDGNDLLYGGEGSDELKGGDGNDRLRLGHADGFGGPGADQLRAGPGHNFMGGGAGSDTFFARDGAEDSINGGVGHDRARVDHHDRLKNIEELF